MNDELRIRWAFQVEVRTRKDDCYCKCSQMSHITTVEAVFARRKQKTNEDLTAFLLFFNRKENRKTQFRTIQKHWEGLWHTCVDIYGQPTYHRVVPTRQIIIFTSTPYSLPHVNSCSVPLPGSLTSSATRARARRVSAALFGIPADYT